MAYKRYIKRGGKVYGPYFQHNKKVNGKVVTEYLGKQREKSSVNLKKGLFVVGIICLVVLSLFFILNLDLTGKVTADIKTKYQEGELLAGNLNFNLKKGELIPADSKVVVAFGSPRDDSEEPDMTKEYFLSELVDTPEGISLEIISGNLYAENVGDLGEGFGFGEMGIKEIYPDVFFELEIVDLEKEDEEIEGEENSELRTQNSEPETEKVEEEKPEKEKKEKKEKEEVESAPITGGVVSEGVIFGVVSSGADFVYSLSESEDAELVEGSVYVNDVLIDDSEVKVKNKKTEVVVSTDYFIEEQGFGEDYLGKKGLTLKINIEEFGFVVQENAEIYIYLVYEDVTLAEAHESISVEGIDEEVVDEVIEPIINFSNDSKEGRDFYEASNFTISNLTIETIQFGAVLNKPVKWKKNVKVEKEGIVRVEIPKQAENITVYKIVDEVGEEIEEKIGEEIIEEVEEEKLEVVNETELEIPIGGEENVTEVEEEINETIIEEEVEKIEDEEKLKKEKKRQKITAQVISAEVTIEVELGEKYNFAKFFSNIFKFMTGRVISVEDTGEIKEVIIEEKGEEFEIEYETPGPVAFESPLGDDSGEPETSRGKKIVISSEVYYENILAWTELPMEISESAVKLYHIVNDTRVEVVFEGYYLNGKVVEKEAFVEDLNESDLKKEVEFRITGEVVSEVVSGEELNTTNQELQTGNVSVEQNVSEVEIDRLINYLEWVVPHLSNQTYELEIIILNVQSYPTVGGNWTVGFNTTGEANLTISAINQTSFGFEGSGDDLEFLELKCGDEVRNVLVLINGTEIPYDVYLKKKRIEEIRRLLG